MPDFAVRTIFNAVDRITPSLKTMTKATDKFANRSQRAFMKASGGVGMFGGAMRQLMPFFGIAMFARVANDAVNLASSLVEVQNVVDTTFGAGANEINKFAQTAITKFGLSELQAKEFTGKLGSMAKSSGITGKELIKMTTDLVALSGDYASFINMQPEDVFQKMQSVVTGTTQPLRDLGFNMTVANLSAFAMSQGITKGWKSMTQAEQVMLRYNYIMKNSKDAQGDFNKTLAESYANQKRVLGVQFDQFLARVATGILPTLVNGFASLNKFLAGVDTDKLSKGLQTIVDILPYVIGLFVAYKIAVIASIVATTAMGLLISAGGIIKGFMLISRATSFATAAQWLFNLALSANPIGLVVIGITLLIAGFMLLVAKTGSITNAFMVIGKTIMKVLLAPINYVLYAIRGILFVASKLPGVGDMAAGALEKIASVQDKMNKPFEINEFDKKAPNASQVAANQNNTNIQINNRNVETTATVTPKRNATITGDLGYAQ